jgi:membrane-bound ClpP family serine protease
MELITILLLIVLGIVLLLVEFLLIPGISIAGVGCLISFGAAIFFSFKFWGTITGIITLVAILIFVPLLLYFLFKGKAVKPMMLAAEIDGKVKNIDEQKIKIGDEGTTVGRLAPMGKVKINGITVEARSLGQYIDPKTKIKSLKIEGNTVIVEPIN